MAGIDDLILRVTTSAPLSPKGSALTWAEMDANMIKIHAAVTALNGALSGVLNLQGGYDPTGTSLYPTSADTLLANNPQKGYAWYVTTAGTINANPVAAGQLIFAIVNNAADNVDASWVIIESALDFAILFETWAAGLPGYDNSKKMALMTTGAGVDAFIWREVIIS